MASSTASGHCDTIEKNTKEVLDHVFMNSFPPSSFPGKFQDFFAALNEDRDDLPSMLEDKLVPRKQEASNSDAKNRRRSKRAFQRHSSEVEVHLNRTSLTDSQGHSSNDGRKSPIPSRRRSSSIAVARPTPDLHRFRQAEAGPWGHLSPSPRSCTRTPTRTSMSPGAASGASSTHLSTGTSPGSPSPTSAAGPGNQATGSRCPGARQYRDRTSSMPAVPRHRVQSVQRIGPQKTADSWVPQERNRSSLT